jgi:hypothetical protein
VCILSVLDDEGVLVIVDVRIVVVLCGEQAFNRRTVETVDGDFDVVGVTVVGADVERCVLPLINCRLTEFCGEVLLDYLEDTTVICDSTIFTLEVVVSFFNISEVKGSVEWTSGICSLGVNNIIGRAFDEDNELAVV